MDISENSIEIEDCNLHEQLTTKFNNLEDICYVNDNKKQEAERKAYEASIKAMCIVAGVEQSVADEYIKAEMSIDEVRPPWVAIPEYSRTSMGWRMGAGEDYSTAFSEYFDALSDEGREKYMRLNPEPESWTGFYETEIKYMKK